MNITNLTYYNTSALKAIVEALEEHIDQPGLYQNVRVRYLGKTKPYERDVDHSKYGRSSVDKVHRLSAQGLGWGQLLDEGEHPRAWATLKGSELVLSIARRGKLLGRGSPSLELVAQTRDEVPEEAVRHIAFALLTTWVTNAPVEPFWSVCPRIIGIGSRVDREDRLKHLFGKARDEEESLSDAIGLWRRNIKRYRQQIAEYEGQLPGMVERHSLAQKEAARLKGQLSEVRVNRILEKEGYPNG